LTFIGSSLWDLMNWPIKKLLTGLNEAMAKIEKKQAGPESPEVLPP